MQFFLDTANLDDLKRGAAWGIIDGVVTNPFRVLDMKACQEAPVAG